MNNKQLERCRREIKAGVMLTTGYTKEEKERLRQEMMLKCR